MVDLCFVVVDDDDDDDDDDWVVVVSNIFGIFTPKIGEDEPNLTKIFFSSFRRPTSFLWGVKRGSQGETCMYPYRFP